MIQILVFYSKSLFRWNEYVPLVSTSTLGVGNSCLASKAGEQTKKARKQNDDAFYAVSMTSDEAHPLWEFFLSHVQSEFRHAPPEIYMPRNFGNSQVASRIWNLYNNEIQNCPKSWIPSMLDADLLATTTQTNNPTTRQQRKHSTGTSF